jgi:radical SAM superfamily enzyme YgiQ (UPF0313 family)
MSRVICVGAGQVSTKKINNRINRRNQYLNYGLLSLASVMRRAGLDAMVFHGHFDDPAITVAIALDHGLRETTCPLLLSVPSFYAVPWANQFITDAKASCPSLRVVVGGRWVIGSRPDLLKELMPEADLIVPDLAESRIVEIVTNPIGGEQASRLGQTSNASKVSFLDYNLLHQRALYQPSVEISRGCGMGCSFCQEKDEPKSKLKTPEALIAELREIILDDGLVPMTPYLETSMFVPSKRWAEEVRAEMDRAEMAIRWRTEGRVDTIKSDLVPTLAASGLSILDLGLESASPIQLKRMGKTRHPEAYLARASRLLEACGANEIKVKVNVLLFAGENDETVAETLYWLDEHKELIYGVSASPVIAFGWPEDTKAYIKHLAEYGASEHHSPCSGVTHLNLSERINYEESLAIARLISKRFMPARNYYTLKSFSYFPRNYSFLDFVEDLALEPGSHAFSTAFLDECIDEMLGMVSQ